MNARIEGLRAQLAAAEAEEREAQQLRTRQRDEDWKALPWEWKVRAKRVAAWFGEAAIEDAVVVQKRRAPAAVEAHQQKYLTDHEPDDVNWQGMTYYRTDEGILTSHGGGHMVLRTPMLCSDTEWAELKAGNIPAKYLR